MSGDCTGSSIAALGRQRLQGLVDSLQAESISCSPSPSTGVAMLVTTSSLPCRFSNERSSFLPKALPLQDLLTACPACRGKLLCWWDAHK